MHPKPLISTAKGNMRKRFDEKRTPTPATAAELFERGQQIINAQTPAAAPEPDVPDWVNETPSDHAYSLIMFESDDSSVENVEVTRSEYIALKEHLAGMRGIIVPAAPAPGRPTITLGVSLPEVIFGRSADLAAEAAEPAADRTMDLIAWFADIEEADCGSDTPAESFIRSLVINHHIRPLTPDHAASELEEFRENFYSMAKAARIFSNKYPEAVEQSEARK